MGNPRREPKIQNLREFTVQIRNVNDCVIGTGFFVSSRGQIITCAHVVRDASETKEVAVGIVINVYFQKALRDDQKQHTATVTACFLPEYDDDVVLLQLDTLSLPDGASFAILGMAEDSERKKFRTFGYRQLGSTNGLLADGDILGLIPSPTNKVLRCEPVQLKSQDIDGGMSGSAVLDQERDLVIGIIAEIWDSAGGYRDRDTCFAVDCKVLAIDPMRLPLADMPTTQLIESGHKIESTTITGQTVPTTPRTFLKNAPEPILEWVGRKAYLDALNSDWDDPDCLITGLIGFGGEGKTSLTRRWLVEVLDNSLRRKPDGVFWWGFYENQNVDEFLEAILKFIEDESYPYEEVTTEKVKYISDMLKTKRYIFVLDGLEVLQYEDGDNYGEFKNTDLRKFLREFANGEHQSFCLLNSRAPFLDLIDFNTYTHRNVERLSGEEGCALLRKVGVKGEERELNQVVADWDGYALVLSLLGVYLVDAYGGDIKHISDIPSPTSGESRYERVQRVLRRYNEKLKLNAEIEFLKIFSAFRLAVPQSAFEPVFQQLKPGQLPPKPKVSFFSGKWFQKIQRWFERIFSNRRKQSERFKQQIKDVSLLELPSPTFKAIIRRLVDYRILRHYPEENFYTIHPLIRAYYSAKADKEIHERIAEYYLRVTGPIPDKPTLENFIFPIEAVHHLCCAESYDEACYIFYNRVFLAQKYTLLHDNLAEYQICLKIAKDFFPNNDILKEPKVSIAWNKGWIRNVVGNCLCGLNKFNEAITLFEQAIPFFIKIEDWYNISINYNSLSYCQWRIGELFASYNSATEGLNFAKIEKNKKLEFASLNNKAYSAYLLGEIDAVSKIFKQIENFKGEIISEDIWWEYFNIRVYTNFLKRLEQTDFARKFIHEGIEYYRQYNRSRRDYILCLISLASLDADAGEHDNALEHYNEAVEQSTLTKTNNFFVHTLSARGCWAARYGNVEMAFNDLNKALNSAISKGLRISEANIRVGLAWAYRATSNYTDARVQAERAHSMSTDMGYHWGKVDADEVLKAIEQVTHSMLN